MKSNISASSNIDIALLVTSKGSSTVSFSLSTEAESNLFGFTGMIINKNTMRVPTPLKYKRRTFSLELFASTLVNINKTKVFQSVSDISINTNIHIEAEKN